LLPEWQTNGSDKVQKTVQFEISGCQFSFIQLHTKQSEDFPGKKQPDKNKGFY
jgi:hypothetical protein